MKLHTGGDGEQDLVNANQSGAGDWEDTEAAQGAAVAEQLRGGAARDRRTAGGGVWAGGLARFAEAGRAGRRSRAGSGKEGMSALPPGLLLFDTGIYIRFIRGENYPWLGTEAQIFQRTILTAVVASELYAGTRSKAEKRAMDELCRSH